MVSLDLSVELAARLANDGTHGSGNTGTQSNASDATEAAASQAAAASAGTQRDAQHRRLTQPYPINPNPSAVVTCVQLYPNQ